MRLRVICDFEPNQIALARGVKIEKTEKRDRHFLRAVPSGILQIEDRNMCSWFTDFFNSSDSIFGPASDDSRSSDSDWSNAFGTGADHQVPAEASYEFPSHDFTSTTYGDSLFSDDGLCSSAGCDFSSPWD